MKITKPQLKRVIKEELKRVLYEQEMDYTPPAMDYTPAGEEIGSTPLPYDPASGRSINQALRRGDISRDEWRTARRAEWKLNDRGRSQQSLAAAVQPDAAQPARAATAAPERPFESRIQVSGDREVPSIRPAAEEPLAPSQTPTLRYTMRSPLTAPPADPPVQDYRQSPENIDAIINYPKAYPAGLHDLIMQGHPDALNLPGTPPEVPVPLQEENQTKSQLKQIIQEELENDPALLSALERLIGKLDNLDSSVDYLAALMSGVSPQEIELSQTAFGRLAGPGATGTEL